jgi:hypothetical protein
MAPARPWQHFRNAGLATRPKPADLEEGRIAINTAAGTPAVFFTDADGNLAKVGVAHVGDTAPNDTPAGHPGHIAGEEWLDTSVTPPVLKIFDGTDWVVPTAGGGSSYVLPIASSTVLGGVKVGNGLEIDATGVLSLVVEVVELLGSADPTAAAPANPTTGNAWVANATGPADATWTGIAGEAVSTGDLLIYDGTNWIHCFSSAGTSGVMVVTGTAPIEVTGTATAPVVGVKVATDAALGVVIVGDGLEVDATGLCTLNADEGYYS